MSARRVSVSNRAPARLGPLPLRSVRGPADVLLWLRGLLGRHLSVRVKLTAWYGLMCGLTLAAAGAAMYIYVDRNLRGDIDSNLVATAGRINARLASSPPVAPAYQPSPYSVPECRGASAQAQLYCAQVRQILDSEAGNLDSPGVFAQVLMDVSTRVYRPPVTITANGRSQIEPSGQPPYLFAYAAAGQIHYLNVLFGGHQLREYLTPLRIAPQFRARGYAGVLAVFQNEATYRSVEHTVLVTLLFGIPLGLLIALIAGWWIARAALRPINRIARTVRAIGDSKDLSRRLHFVGPSDEVGRLAETFDGMMDRLERVFEGQKRFIADASHELRTPLTAIRGNADLMRIAPPEDQEICLTSIRREAERMTRLVSDLLLLAEADVAEQQIQRVRVDLDELVLDVYRAAQAISDGKVDVLLEDTDPVCVEGDPDRLKQLLLNLVDNAIKFTPEGGTVSLGLRQENGEAVLHVSDSGIGIPPEEQAAIFERFYRVEESRAKRGSGLGLSISAWVVKAHNGSLDVSSEPDMGSTFTIRLPVAAPIDAAARA